MDRFWSKVQKTESCWMWQNSCYTNGYGKFHYMGKHKRAHRVAWILVYGEIPKGLYVLHRCDEKRCVRPDHLFIGTQKENIRDAMQKKRFKPCRLPTSVETLAHIKAQYERGLGGVKKLAKMLHVSRQTVLRALNGVQRHSGQKPILTAEQVREARLLHDTRRYGSQRLSRLFGVGEETMRNVLRRKTYKNIS